MFNDGRRLLYTPGRNLMESKYFTPLFELSLESA